MEQCTCRDSIERATHPDHRNGQTFLFNSEAQSGFKAQSFYKAVFGQKFKRGQKTEGLGFMPFVFSLLSEQIKL